MSSAAAKSTHAIPVRPESEAAAVFARNLKALMDYHGHSTLGLSKIGNVGQSTVSAWLLGQKAPRMHVAENTARIYGLSLHEMLDPNLKVG